VELKLPELSLVVLIGASGSGKSSFARKHFLPTEVLSSDFFRGLVSDNENDQSATNDAFELLHAVASKRLGARRLTVVDATNVQSEARRPLVQLARRYHCLPVAIVLNLPEKLCHERNVDRPNRDFGRHVVRQQSQQLRRSLRSLKREGFRHIHVLKTPEDVDNAFFTRTKLWNDRREETGPFDIIGDVHGCFDELVALLSELGYRVDGTEVGAPEGRKAVFLGDLVDRGPNTPAVVRLVMGMVEKGDAFCVPGNHDVKLVRKLWGKNVQLTHGLQETMDQLDGETAEFKEEIQKFLHGLVSHYVLDGGKLVVAHAGLKEELQGRASGKVREFCLYGETTGETDEFGLPVRYPWAEEYRGNATVVYGHTPVPEPDWLNRTVNIDTGCVFGGKLTALRYPEKELVSVPAREVYAEPIRPLVPEETGLTAQQQHDDQLYLEDVFGKRIVTTGMHRTVTIREENATAALEVMSRFAVNPKWLIYLPPTMSPSETTQRDGYLEYPDEALGYFASKGVSRVICEEKHMGSRAVIVLCRDEETARERFGVHGEGIGVVYSRTGRPFFPDKKTEQAILERLGVAVGRAGIWEDLDTNWLCLDAEIMPWSAKAQALLQQQYAAVGAAATSSLRDVVRTLDATADHQDAAKALHDRFAERLRNVELYRDAYRRYCWPVKELTDYTIAPFHVLASEGKVHTDQPHTWHMETIAGICAHDEELLLATNYRVIDLQDEESRAEAVAWWEQLTADGGEGMVVKPESFIARGKKGLLQPALKCRGREYLRIIYSPEYTAPEHLSRLRDRGVGRKRSLALREFALGIEALDRFVNREPLRRVHECCFGVLAMESEPVDPRL
jgi:protein phosphatase